MALRRRNTPLGNFTRFLTAAASSNNTLDHLSVLAWGSGHQGVLGQGNVIPNDEFEPVEISSEKNNLQLPPDIIGVGAGSFHSLAWTSEGQLFSWGRNNEGQLGRPLAATELNFSSTPSAAIFLPETYQVKSATGSGVATFVITTDGLLLVAGSSKRGQLGLGSEIINASNFQHVSLPGKVLSVAAGWGHAAALVEDGSNTKMYTWGWPAHGRLGHSFATCPEDDIEEALGRRCVFEPKEIELLRGVKISSIACGMDTTYAITQDGRLLSFGDNSLGQLGRTETDVEKEGFAAAAPKDAAGWEVRVPRESNSSKDVKFRKIAPGLGHCLAVTGGGSVLSWGWNTASQSGLGEVAENEKEIVYRPRLLFGVAKNRLAMIGAGRVHSVLITDELHQEKVEMPTAFGRNWPCLTMAYTWGSAANGRLGTGTYEDAPFPELLNSLDGEMMVDLACGMDHTLVLVGREAKGPGPLTAFSIEE
jgi:alpha-tubulin suppressor-like RCC1 family protein